MSQLGCLLIGLAVVVGVSAGRKIKKVSDILQVANTTEHACDAQVTRAIQRNCATRFLGRSTCGSNAVCKCAADHHITGEDQACKDLPRKFDPEHLKLSLAQDSKGCACVHDADKLTCSFDAPQVCDQCKYKKQNANVETFANMNEKVDKTFPILLGGDYLPEQLQGVFWLTDQASSSALVSFGQSDDGGGLSSLDANTFISKVRVSGDRVWSFADLGGNMDAAFKYDLVYEFRFDDATNPTHAEIIPSPRKIPLADIVGDILEKPWILSFTMDLLKCKSPQNDEEALDKNPKDDEEALDCSEDPKYLEGFDKSFVWQRKSTLFKQALGGPANYKAVQVIKADGTKLPAFKHWMDYAKTEETGGTPGVFHWYQIDNTEPCK